MAASFVQINKGDFTTSHASFSVTLSSGVTAGNFVVVAGSFGNSATTVVVSDGGDAVTDSGKGIVNNAAAAHRTFVVAFLAPTAGTTTFTATYSGGTNPTFGDLFVWEISGLTSPVFDKVAEATGNVATADSGSTGTLSSATEAGIAFGASSAAVAGAGSGWTTGQGSTVGSNTGDGNTASTSSLGEHRVIAATTAINGTSAASSSGEWTMWCATFMGGVGTVEDSRPGPRPGSRRNKFLVSARGPRPARQPDIQIATLNANLTQDDSTLQASAEVPVIGEPRKRPVKPRKLLARALTLRGSAQDAQIQIATLNAALTQSDATLTAAAGVTVGLSANLTQADAALSATSLVTVGLSATLTQADASLSADVTVVQPPTGVEAVESWKRPIGPRKSPLARALSLRRGIVDAQTQIATLNANLTQADATLTATAAVNVGLTANLTQADASLSAAAAVLVQPSANLTQANASLSAAAAVLVQSSATLTQDSASLTAATAVLVQPSATLTQDDFTLVADASAFQPGNNLSANLTQDDSALSADVTVAQVSDIGVQGGGGDRRKRKSARKVIRDEYGNRRVEALTPTRKATVRVVSAPATPLPPVAPLTINDEDDETDELLLLLAA